MKRTALFFASTAILFSSPAAMADQPPINRPFISSNSNVPAQMLAQAEETAPQAEQPVEELKKHKGGRQAEEAKKRASEETDAAAKEQQKAEEQAKRQADQAARASEKESEQKAEEAKRAANAEADKAAKQQNAIEEEAKQKAAQEAKSAKAAEKEAAQEAEKARQATEAESNKAAKQQKAVEEEARKKAAADSDAAKAAEKQTAKEAEKVKKATEQEADKAAEAQKAAEEEARKKTDSAQKAADKQTDKAAETAKKATDKAAKETPAAPAPDAPATAEQPSQAAPAEPTTKEAKPVDPATGKAAQQEASPLPENAAPALDSAKRAPAGETPDKPKQGQAAEAPADQKPVAQQPAVAAPKNDADVQQELAPVKIEPVLTEKGTRTKDRRPDERPGDVQVVKKFGDRTVVNIDNNVYVESSDRPRMSRDSKDVYYEDLPRNRTRETIVRDNGVQIVTIRNRYGDVIRRSRVMPDGHEVVLTYTPDYDREERLEWRDPGDDLPPLALNIPVRDYILDAEEAPQEEVYEFFEQPPVERVERIYSIDEVKRSARIRDKVRRVDLDTITFQFGSADVGEDQISHIESVAKAMAQILKKNPAETFLIEGHTDAVGSDQANLVLSDRRAESVAQALTNVFDIPPENMATQGYGEQYLKIKADGPEQENRRVAIRRITPLVAPVASN
ncbi:OmpA family protein [Phyllobacterium bourgognense]|nr:OmpA family protein [Phyllobacterium bourgognense]